jgi:hypothetical protein
VFIKLWRKYRKILANTFINGTYTRSDEIGYCTDIRLVKALLELNTKPVEASGVVSSALITSLGASCRPIPFSNGLASIIHQYLWSVKDEDFDLLTPPLYLSEDVRGELKRYMVAIEAYLESFKEKSEEPLMTKEFLINGILDKGFSKLLKEIKQKAFITACGNRLINPPDGFKDIPTYCIHDIGDIFCYRYCFFWEEDKPDDIYVCLDPVPLVPERTKKNLLRIAIELFEEVGEIEFIEEKEILLLNSGTACLKGDGHSLKRSHVYKEKEKYNYFSSEPLFALREVIRVCPQGYRDSTLLSVPHTNSIKLIERQMALICERLKYSAYWKDPQRIQDRLGYLDRRYRQYLNRDIRKEGISKPWYLIEIIHQALKKVYPGMPCLAYMEIYKKWYIFDDDENHTPIEAVRGHGLGMANALTTIMQCILFTYCVRKYTGLNGTDPDLFDAVFYNDDSVITHDDVDMLEDYAEFEETEFNELGLLWHKGKTQLGRGMIFLENYFYTENINDKRSYYLYGLHLIFACVNIVQAKQYSTSICMSLDFDYKKYINKIRQYWGYEFHADEINLPYIFGGWFTMKIYGVDCSFYFLSEENKRICYKGLQATLTREKMYRQYSDYDHSRKTRMYRNTLNQIYLELNLGYFDKTFEQHDTQYDADRNYFRTLDPMVIVGHYQKSLSMRFKAYRKACPRDVTIREIVHDVMSHNKEIDYVIPPGLYRHIQVEMGKQKDIKPSANPSLSYLKYFNYEIISEYVRPDPRSFIRRTESSFNREKMLFDRIQTNLFPVDDGEHGDIFYRYLKRPTCDRISIGIPAVDLYNAYVNPKWVCLAQWILYGQFYLADTIELKMDMSNTYLYLLHISNYRFFWEEYFHSVNPKDVIPLILQDEQGYLNSVFEALQEEELKVPVIKEPEPREETPAQEPDEQSGSEHNEFDTDSDGSDLLSDLYSDGEADNEDSQDQYTDPWGSEEIILDDDGYKPP